MSCTIFRHRVGGALVLAVTLAESSFVTACDALDVSDPTAIEESEISNASGANLMRGDAVWRL